jgi:putative acetyltransferase
MTFASIPRPVTRLRRMRPDEADALAAIFFDAVRVGAAAFYDERQRAAWAPTPPEPAAWATRLAAATVCVAVDDDDAAIGFITVDDDGYVDLAFVAPAAAGRGVGTVMTRWVESWARARGLSRLHTQASLGAQPMFRACGWTVLKTQQVKRDGVTLENAVMEKLLVS